MAEFDFINKYFHRGKTPDQVMLDKGDDCALIAPSIGCALAVTTDTLVCGTHFLPDIHPHALAYRALATNISDLAAMGALPKWFSLAICLPKDLTDTESWLDKFSQGLFQLADKHNIYLIGGDTTSGPLSITITAMGEVEPTKALTRSAAQVGDRIFASGNLGGAAGALDFLLAKSTPINSDIETSLLQYFNYPEPQVELGLLLAGKANAAIDISDGLLADLSHILKASNVAASVDLDLLPIDDNLIKQFGLKKAQMLAATGGDDYQLCFTVPDEQVSLVKKLSSQARIQIKEIGIVKQGRGLEIFSEGEAVNIDQKGYQHFA
ncbi:thiamine-phosphate kinase [Catenovulum maritimum]|uniref:Thiamine-monophosphate kinase n=1 Tax=Catenovulum maritimum TaxID=1513271 RepID=A0A0J8GV86_9ALTE|nr:thiamine-phosphate kinase [Catenovulum maritimum]KMT65219.1 hypothetical protein XM47_10710 [Catenovulum maritimum]